MIQAENICRKSCLQNYQVSDQEQNVSQYIDQFEHCLKDCTAGSWEIVKLSKKHAEISRMTVDRNLWKCDQVYKEMWLALKESKSL